MSQPDAASLGARTAHLPVWLREVWAISVITILLVCGTAVVYLTGGTSYAFPYIQFVPVLTAAARYGMSGGIAVAVVGALLLGPFMPMDVQRGIDQSTANWLTRLAFFILLGGFTGWLFERVRTQLHERDRLARVDRPTGLGNRAALEERLEYALASSTTFGPGHTMVYIVRMSDFFDALDAVGFDAADELARTVAMHIEHEIPEVGASYRFSAAELAFIANGVESSQAGALAARIKSAGEQSVNVRGVPVRVELCIGGARARIDETDRRYDPLRRAHLALFTAEERQQGYALYDKAYERANREIFRLITRVREALHQGHFELFYQPKIRLSDGAVTGAETLIRWRDPVDGIITPGLFIPKVERTSLIGPVTRFAFREACRFAEDHPDLDVSVNISPRNLYDDELLEELSDILGRLEVPASGIEIEITEGTVAHDPDQAARRLSRLRGHGVRLSIDDFGTGYSSFSYLHRLPVTGLKIDRSFLVEQEEDPRVTGILRCITQVGRELELEVIAEGVETEEQLVTVREIGCDLAQGFYFAEPQPAEDFERWLEHYERTRGS